MKKIALLVLCATMIGSIGNTFASVKVAAQPTEYYNGEDYVGDIVASEYAVDSADGQQNLLIITAANKNNRSNLKGLTLKITDKDLPFGLTLASATGKQIAVLFKNPNYDINYVEVITDQYWNGQ